MSSFLIDTHTHLDFQQYDADRELVIERAKDAQVKALLCVGIDLPTSRQAIAIAEHHPNLFATVGVHPHDACTVTGENLEQLRELVQHPKVVALGEVGLDYYRKLSPLDTQRRIFRVFLDWAKQTDLPLIIHTREADEDIITILRERARTGWRGVFHCFSGDQRMADKVLELGFLISFTGSITFQNSRSAEVVKHVPIEKLMVETDSPFMAPVPHRGKRNEPALVNYVAQKMAELKGLPYDEVARITSQNAIDLFGLQLVDAP